SVGLSPYQQQSSKRALCKHSSFFRFLHSRTHESALSRSSPCFAWRFVSFALAVHEQKNCIFLLCRAFALSAAIV
uniref:hypothetical protein n=1 Tax=Lachnospira sp. TaxID=2049031 RepID=UPI0040280FF3